MTVAQIAQRAIDLDRAANWYSMFLDRVPTARFEPPGLVFFVLGDLRLLLDRAAPSALHYFRVDHLDEKLERLRGEGLRIHTEPHLIFTHTDDLLGPAGATERQAFVLDSEDNLVGLIELTHPIT